MGNFFDLGSNQYLIGLLVIASILQFLIKGVALWRASQLKQKNWFIAIFILLPLNDIGIVEVIYLCRFAKKRLTIKELKSWLKFKR